MIKIFKKEMQSYLLNPVGYVYLAAFFIITGIYFWGVNIYYGCTNFGQTLTSLKIVLAIFIPAITMKLLAEERKNKTEQLLLTSPISITDIVMGKFLAATGMFLLTLIISVVYPIILFNMTTPYLPELVSAYVGFFLLGVTFISICLYISSVTESQVVAFILGISTILVFWLIENIESAITNEYLKKVVESFFVVRRYNDFGNGILNISSIFYYMTVISIFIFLTIRKIEKRRIG